jgi:serine/threonine-protein kinase
VWTENISKGGLFVRTEQPPARGTTVEVIIETPDGAFKLRAEVVHVIDEATARQVGHPSGVGLQFIDLSPENKAAIFRYVEGVADRLEQNLGSAGGSSSGAGAPTGASVERALARAREFISGIEKNDLYGALVVPPNAPAQDIAQRLADLRQVFSGAKDKASPPQLARLNAALKLLDRAAALLNAPERRLEYDLKKGHASVEEYVARAKKKTGPSLGELREVWIRVFPERLEQAAAAAHKAFEAKRKRDLPNAVQAGRAALALDPFHEELRQTVEAWEGMVSTSDRSRRKP